LSGKEAHAVYAKYHYSSCCLDGFFLADNVSVWRMAATFADAVWSVLSCLPRVAKQRKKKNNLQNELNNRMVRYRGSADQLRGGAAIF